MSRRSADARGERTNDLWTVTEQTHPTVFIMCNNDERIGKSVCVGGGACVRACVCFV